MFKKIRDIRIRNRFRRKLRIRNTISGTAVIPRVSVFKSNRHIFVQVIDDVKGITLCSASTSQKDAKLKGANIASARKVGEKLADLMIGMNIRQAVFDRNGYIYHGKIAAVADALRSKEIRI